MFDLDMFDLIKWFAWMAVITFLIMVLRAIFHKPASVPNKRWLFLTTPELIECAFTTKRMYGIAEKTAKLHLDKYGAEGWINLYTDLFKAYESDPTTDGYRIKGDITDLGDQKVRLVFELDRSGETTHYLYEVSYLHLARVTDVLSPALLARLDWHKKTLNRISEG
ncbi:hypothetical protein pEaSNUABM37_00142 [Erwinia phage pEa_SNUABM_37]|nr:hypothetical protein pEaSNUABM37_00142 [Erwinia phage pEa_SNUABM_37]QXO10612.1 hypothetical protein pEaSNUABM48_00142 [Erwinia phage pEa_SNUABM_48]